MNNKMVIGNLLYRPLRSLISIVAVALEVTLILVIVGLSVGMLQDAKARQEGIGADLMVRPPGSSFLSGISGAPVPARIADVLASVPHVAAVAPVVTQLNTAGGSIEVVYGIDLASFQALAGPFHYLSGGPFEHPDDILVDDFFADAQHVRVGSTISVFNHPFRVCGIVLHGKGARKFLPMTTMQDLIGAQGKASIFYVKVDEPSNVNEVQNSIKHIPGMQSYSVQSMKEWLSLMTVGNLPGFSAFINVVIGVAVAIGFIVIFQAMYTAVMERTREIGILKSLGASKFYIVSVILRETLLIAICGIAVGIGISFLARSGIHRGFPTLQPLITAAWIAKATLIAILGALFGALYPAYKAAQKDPIDALSYE